MNNDEHMKLLDKAVKLLNKLENCDKIMRTSVQPAKVNKAKQEVRKILTKKTIQRKICNVNRLEGYISMRFQLVLKSIQDYAHLCTDDFVDCVDKHMASAEHSLVAIDSMV